MNHLRTLPAAAVVVATLALVFSLISPRSEAQFTAVAQSFGNWWPPHPRDQVHLYDSQGLGLAPASEQVLFQVPPDKWLVLLPTAWHSSGGAIPSSGLTAMTSNTTFAIFEEFGGSYKERSLGAPVGSTGINVQGPISATPIGWAFKPGSRVVLRNVGSAPGMATFNIFGYLTNP